MVREVQYVVQPSMLLPDKMIFVGTHNQSKGKVTTWRTRCDCTEQVTWAFLKHKAEQARKFCKEHPESKGMKQSFKLDSGEEVIIEVRISKQQI